MTTQHPTALRPASDTALRADRAVAASVAVSLAAICTALAAPSGGEVEG